MTKLNCSLSFENEVGWTWHKFWCLRRTLTPGEYNKAGRSGPFKFIPWLWRHWPPRDTSYLGGISIKLHRWPQSRHLLGTFLKSLTCSAFKWNFRGATPRYLVSEVPCATLPHLQQFHILTFKLSSTRLVFELEWLQWTSEPMAWITF